MISLKWLRHRVYTSPLRVPFIWYRHFGLLDNDIIMAAYPRSGSTWLRFMIYAALLGKQGSFIDVDTQIPYIGKHKQLDSQIELKINGARLIMTHESYRPEYRRGFYVYRNPALVAVSEYKHRRMRSVDDRDFDSFLQAFIHGNPSGYQNWATHVRSWIDSPIAQSGNLHLIDFHDLKNNTHQTLRDLFAYLEVDVPESAIDFAVESNNLAAMKKAEEEGRKEHPRLSKLDKDLRFINEGRATVTDVSLNDEQQAAMEAYFAPLKARLGH